MSSNQAAQQIANLLMQAGVPAGHSLDVAQRLLSMSNSGPAAARGSREITSSQANNSAFFNRYKSDEQTAKDGVDGKAGKDGLPGYGGRGVDGKDGIPGAPGAPGEINWDNIRQMIASMIAEALQGFLTNLLTNVLTCRWFLKKFEDCVKWNPGGGGKSDCPKCCNDPAIGIMKNVNICQKLWQFSQEFARIKGRLTKIEKDLADTTDCEA